MLSKPIFAVSETGDVTVLPQKRRTPVIDAPCSIGLSGSWREVPPIMHHDILQLVRWTVTSGHRLVTGGALGADFTATEEALRLFKLLAIPDPQRRLLVILPTSLEVYARHFRAHAQEGIITSHAAEALISQLTEIAAMGALEEMTGKVCSTQTYYARNGKLIHSIHRLAAFQTNNSKGVQNAVDTAHKRGLPVLHKTYRERQYRNPHYMETLADIG